MENVNKPVKLVSCHTCCGSRLPSEGAWYVEVFGDPGFLLELKPVSICSQLCVEYHHYQIVHANKAALHEYIHQAYFLDAFPAVQLNWSWRFWSFLGEFELEFFRDIA